MKNFKNIIYLSTLSWFLFSCAQYGMIADNDVYLQKPSAVVLDGDANDPTTFNNFRAGREGQFVNRNNIAPRMFLGVGYGMYGGNFGGMNSPFYDPFYGPGFSPFYNPYAPFGGNGWNNGWNNGFGHPYGYGYGYNGFGNNYGYGNYYNNGDFFGGSNSVWSSAHEGPTYYGPRGSLSSSSARSSAYPETMKSSVQSGYLSTPRRSDNFNSKASNQSSPKSTEQVLNRRVVDTREYVRPTTVSNERVRSSSAVEQQLRGAAASMSRSNPNSVTNAAYRPSQAARNSGVTTSTYDRRNASSRPNSSTYSGSNSGSSSNGARGSFSSPKNGSSRSGFGSSSSSRSPGVSSGGSSSRSSGSSGSSRSSSSSSSRSGGRR
jgi:hypothetical protein